MLVCTVARSSSTDAMGCQRLGEAARVGVILGEALAVMVDAVQGGGGEEAGLAHRAAEHAALPRRRDDQVARAGEERAAGRAEAFRERDRDQVERRRELGLGDAARDARVPQTRAVEEGRDAARARQRADANDLVLREDDAAAAVVGVLDLDQRRRRIDRQAARLDRRLERGDVEDAARADLDQLHAGVRRRAAGLVPAGVGLAADDDLVARPRQHAQRDLVGHRPRRQPERPASLPSSAATRACSSLVSGSSPYWSSPTGAAAIAARIAGVGRVTVSERRSIGSLLMRRLSDEPACPCAAAARTDNRRHGSEAGRVRELGPAASQEAPCPTLSSP